MAQTKLREEVSNEFKWDLTKVYKTLDEFNKEYDETKKLISNFKKWEGKTTTSASNLYNSIQEEDEIDRKLEKLHTYANMLSDQDTSNNTNQELKNRVINLYHEANKNTYFTNVELLNLDYKKIEEYYKEEPKLLEYQKVIKEAFRYKDHKLSESEEKLLSNISMAFGNDEEVYSYLVDSDMTFGTIKDENNEEVELTDTNFSIYIKSKDRRVRKDAFVQLYKYYKQFKNTISSTFDGSIKQNVANARIRKYNSAFEASLFSDEINKEVFDSLVNTIHNNLDVLYKYYDLKKEMLEVDELHLYDIYTDLVKEDNTKYTFDQAKEIVLNALSVLGKEYVDDLKQAFNDKWIDIYPNKNKRGGAYSGGSYDTNPYVLLNYQDQLNDVSTLAHELGHSMHSYYTRKNQPYQYGDYPIFVAEVASTVNELLLSKYMLKNSNSKNERLNILSHLLDLFKATIYRQTMFAEFEKQSYDIVEKNEVITSDKLCKIYYDLNKLYFGDNVVVDQEIQYEWEKVPHFYYNFYVYKYATGLSAACKIVTDILDGKENARENYLNMLKNGCRENPINTLAIANVDMCSKEVYESAVKMFNDAIEEFKTLIKKK